MALFPEPNYNGNSNLIPERRSLIVVGELKSRISWCINLRWTVPGSIIIGTVIADALEFRLSTMLPVTGVTIFIALYNLAFRLAINRLPTSEERNTLPKLRFFIRWQLRFDYISMLLLIHLTGGIASPLIFFLFFHIIFSSILLTRLNNYLFTALVALGMTAIAVSEYRGLLPHYALSYNGQPVDPDFQPHQIAIVLFFFSSAIFVTAFSTTSIMDMMRTRISSLVDLSFTVKHLNERLKILFSIVKTIGSVRHLNTVLTSVTTQLTEAMEIQGVSVKLLSEDGRFLNYVAAYGFGEEVLKNRVIEVSKSPLNERVIKGEPFVAGHVTRRELFQFGENLAAANINSVLFVPLIVEDKVIGILGGYSRYPERFDSPETEFFRMAAGLIAVVLDNSIAYEKIEQMSQERTRFMLKVAHNLKAPLSAILSILDVIRGNYLGELNEDQNEYLRRIHRRAQTMIKMVSELLTLAQKRNENKQATFISVDLEKLMGRINRTFSDEARQKGLDFDIKLPEKLPHLKGDPEMIEQMLENLISNAIRYTPGGGKVTVEFVVLGDQGLRIMISDNGIGIPKSSIPNVFDEFYRAKNAQAVEEHGTGLGMSIVKEIVEEHSGQISLESEEGLGTLVVVQLPVLSTFEQTGGLNS